VVAGQAELIALIFQGRLEVRLGVHPGLSWSSEQFVKRDEIHRAGGVTDR
jgi:hypothetical protein